MTRPTRAVINLTALQHNLQQVRQYAPNSQVMAMIKANGYGHGAVEVAKALQQAAGSVDALAVACLEEALELREAGIHGRMILIEGAFSQEELEQAMLCELDVVVHQPEQVAMLAAIKPRKPLHVWLKLDTGMHRLGVDPEQLAPLYSRLRDLPSVAGVNLMSHFSSAAITDSPFTEQQTQHFDSAMTELAPQHAEFSLANSAAIMAWPDTHRDWVRPGLMLFGVSPFGAEQLADNLQPVMTLESGLISMRDIVAGDPVGYDNTWHASRDSRIGVVALGYGDGYPWSTPSGTSVLLQTPAGPCEVPTVGRVSMDMLAVDLTDCPAAELGQRGVLWGEGLPIERLADSAGTSAYELVCSINRRVPRVYQYR